MPDTAAGGPNGCQQCCLLLIQGLQSVVLWLVHEMFPQVGVLRWVRLHALFRDCIFTTGCRLFTRQITPRNPTGTSRDGKRSILTTIDIGQCGVGSSCVDVLVFFETSGGLHLALFLLFLVLLHFSHHIHILCCDSLSTVREKLCCCDSSTRELLLRPSVMGCCHTEVSLQGRSNGVARYLGVCSQMFDLLHTIPAKMITFQILVNKTGHQSKLPYSELAL